MKHIFCDYSRWSEVVDSDYGDTKYQFRVCKVCGKICKRSIKFDFPSNGRVPAIEINKAIAKAEIV